jgi:hypothetical protein
VRRSFLKAAGALEKREPRPRPPKPGILVAVVTGNFLHDTMLRRRTALSIRMNASISVCTENSDSHVLVMQSAEERL